MNIYNTVPYTYLIGWSKLDKWYYGVRYANNCNPSDLWVKYFTSSKIVKQYCYLHGQPDIIEIRKTFKSKKSARLWEARVLDKLDAKNNNKFLNKSNATSKMNREGIINVKDLNGIQVDISVEEFKNNRNKYIHFTEGKFSAKDIHGNIFLVSKDDHRIINGELQSISKGTIPVRDSSGKCFRVSRNDPRYLSGELLHVNKGSKMKNASTAHMNVKITCLICLKTTNLANYHRWHKHV